MTGLYVSGGAGLNIMQNEADHTDNGVSTTGKSLEFNVGATGVGAIGWSFGNGLRAELEFDYRYNGLSQSIRPGLPNGMPNGSEQKFGPMVNALYDFNGLSPVFVPYLGLGARYQWADVSATSVDAVTGTAGAFAYQAIVGAAFPIGAVAGLAVTTEYRFIGLAGTRDYSGNVPHATIGRTDDFNHSILLGLRYNFGVAPRRRLPPRLPLRRRHRHAATWCSSTGIRPL